MSVPSFVVQTCESKFQNTDQVPIRPIAKSELSPFEAVDPFGLRKAILPVFERNPEDGTLIGIGTAFHIDGWGGCLTAEHVLEFARSRFPENGLNGQPIVDLDPSLHRHPVLLLGIGLCYGSALLPEWAIAPIVSTNFSTRQRSDPFTELQGRRVFEVAEDVAFVKAHFHPDAIKRQSYPQSLPVELRGWQPTIGEYVLAFGYPSLKPSRVMSVPEIQDIVEDDLQCAYARITEVYPEGRGSTNITPVFEVEGNWLSGMSGGPVVNNRGNVVGIVSRSLMLENAELSGRGYATCLPWIGSKYDFFRRIDHSTPGWRMGYGVLNDKDELLGIYPERHLGIAPVSQDDSLRLAFCSNRIGSSDYLCA